MNDEKKFTDMKLGTNLNHVKTKFSITQIFNKQEYKQKACQNILVLTLFFMLY